MIHAGAGSSPPPSVLYLAGIDFPHLKARAIQIVNTCHALARAGCRVTMVIGRRERGPVVEQLARYGLAPEPRLRIVGVPAVRLPPRTPTVVRRLYTRFWNWSYVAGCLARLPMLLGDSNSVLMARDYRLAWLLLHLGRLHRRRLVFEVHNLPSAELLDSAPPTTSVHREADRRRALEQSVFRGAWRLLTITECLRERLIRDYGVPSDRVFTVPDAGGRTAASARAAEAPGADGATPADATFAGRKPTLVYVGQLYRHKGVDLIVRALVEVSRAELLIVGGLPDDPELARIERLVADLGLRDRVRLAGPQPYERVPALLATADVALLPLADGLVARCFTSPLKLFDYLAAGLPIVAVDFPTIREVLQDGHNGLLVPPNDPSAMAAAVNRLLDDPPLAARLAARARRDAASYTWERRAERILLALGAGRGAGGQGGWGAGEKVRARERGSEGARARGRGGAAPQPPCPPAPLPAHGTGAP